MKGEYTFRIAKKPSSVQIGVVSGVPTLDRIVLYKYGTSD